MPDSAQIGTPHGAVFLSYASQDAQAAKRICEALHAAGIEVWFDQSELVGGDVWDQSIRRQINECALFVPIISSNTQGRLEGYFRLEWRLAEQRSHLMARGKPFLVPVVLDGTKDNGAHVPDSFLEVQWTRLPEGAATPAFCERMTKLLQFGSAGRVESPQKPQPAPSAVTPRAGRPWLLPAVVVLAAAGVALAVWRPRHVAPDARQTEASPASSPAASAEFAQVRARVQADQWKMGDFDAVSSILGRVIQANPDNADAWALRSIINSLQVLRNFDSGTRPLEEGRAAAERALSLTPTSPFADLAQGMHLTAMISRGGDPLSARPYVDRAIAALPHDGLTRYAELTSYWLGYQFEGTERSAMAWLTDDPHASFPRWILAQMYLGFRDPIDAEKWANGAVSDEGITGLRARLTVFESNYYLRADLKAARAALERIPVGARSTSDRALFALWLEAMAEGNFDQALQELERAPKAMFSDRVYHGPKALLTGLAHKAAGRSDVALSQFHEAEKLLKGELETDAENEELHAVLAYTLACSGRSAEARGELASLEPLMRGRAPSIYSDPIVLLIAQTHGMLGEADEMVVWLRKLLSAPAEPTFTPASLRIDPRFKDVIGWPQMQALLAEFSRLDQYGSGKATAPMPSSLGPR
jgi:tetratricopeptide (TPR) repeat protein